MDKSAALIVENIVETSPQVDKTDDVKTDVVPSVGADAKPRDLNFGGNAAPGLPRRKRPRRKSKKGKQPYNKADWQRRKMGRNSSERAQKLRQIMFAHGQPVAPYNTNQFLMEDHAQNIDTQIQVAQDPIPGSSLLQHKPSRARDSSFSIDSDDDHFYSSPEDEEEFLTKEFSNAYEDVHVERLNAMSKPDIIQDYLQLESKYEKSMFELRRLRRIAGEQQVYVQHAVVRAQEADEPDRDTDASTKSDSEVAELLRISQMENKTLKVELEELRKANITLHAMLEKNQSSSVDSSSSSESTTDDTSSTSDSDSDDEMAEDKSEEVTENRLEEITEDGSDEMEKEIQPEEKENIVNGMSAVTDEEPKPEEAI